MLSAPYFLITKLEAFDGRGKGDYLMSHDMEDIIAVLDGRPEVVNEVKGAELKLVNELSDRFTKLLQDNRFVDSISGHMPTDAISQAKVSVIVNVINEIVNYRKE
ncbi:MAG: hypothetical protein ACC657_16775 [Thiohalomonadales bacterium]